MTKLVKRKAHGGAMIWQRVGRLPKFESPEALQKLFKKYFKDTEFFEYSITGLALACGTSRQTLYVYGEKDEFKDIIAQAKTIVEHSYEMSLRKNGRTTDIFALKQFGWQDVVTNENKNPDKAVTGINWIGDINFIENKTVNVIDGKETKALPKGEEESD